MKRHKIEARKDWKQRIENLEFNFHTADLPAWKESAYYEFSQAQADEIKKASQELWSMCLVAVQHVIDHKLYDQFNIPKFFWQHIEDSWAQNHPSIYGCLDLAYKDGQIKLLEFNADTPPNLFESSIVQWYWLQDFDPKLKQFNQLHEKLIENWQHIKHQLKPGTLHFTCLSQSLEELTSIEYLRDCAIQADIETHLVFLEDIGWAPDEKVFVDFENEIIKNIFKLYPYEYLVNDDFSRNILQDSNKSLWIEPSWKMILSNKAILVILWELYPDHPYLLKTQFDSNEMHSFARKPILSREGANITLVDKNVMLESSTGDAAEETYIFQDLFTLPKFDDQFPLISSWIIGSSAAGMVLRESQNLITTYQSQVVPHVVL